MKIEITRVQKDRTENSFILENPADLALELIGWDIETTTFENDTLNITVSDATPED
ncbi:hypothetical protein GOV10_02115 [Candidatus Woesearchaeota archaeon]|nr:hypothetical protein [Candidatus Woesearchaeota archaeon]